MKTIISAVAAGAIAFSAIPSANSIAPAPKLLVGDTYIDEENALSVLVEILSQTPLWDNHPDVRICTIMIGSRIIEAETRIADARAILSGTTPVGDSQEDMDYGDEPLTPYTALTVLTGILSETPLWEDHDVRVCVKFIGSRIIRADSKIEAALSALNAD